MKSFVHMKQEWKALQASLPLQALRFNFLSSLSPSLSPATLPPSPLLPSSSPLILFLLFKVVYQVQFNLIPSGPNILSGKWQGRLWKAYALGGLISTNILIIPACMEFWESWRLLTVCILKGFSFFCSHIISQVSEMLNEIYHLDAKENT